MLWHGKNFRGIINKAKEMIFDNTGTNLISTNAEDAIKEVNSNLINNSWVLSTGFAYRKKNGLTQVRIEPISVTHATFTSLGTLPIEYRPDADITLSIYSDNTGYYANVLISTSGSVEVMNNTSGSKTLITY